MSEIKVNSIKGVAASTAALTINNTDGTCTANLTNRTNKNIVVNGSQLIAQRGTSSTSSGYQTVDRFPVFLNGCDENPTISQADIASGTTPYTLGFRKSLKITNGNQTSGAGSNDYIWIQNKIEAQDIANSGWNYLSASSYITLSFWVKSSVAQTFKGYIETMDGTAYQYPFETGSLTADTWTKITKTISGNSNLQFDNNNEEGFKISIIPMMGTDKTASSVTEDAWSTFSSSARIKDVTTTWYTTNDATFEMTGVQLEVGSVATDFEHLSFSEVQRRCQRYCVVYQGSAAPLGNNGQITMSGANGFLAYGNAVNGASPMVTQQLPQVMRSTPSQSVSNGTHFQFWRGWTTTIASTGVYTESVGHSPIHFRYYIGSNGGMNNGDAGILNFSSTSGYQIYDAEL